MFMYTLKYRYYYILDIEHKPQHIAIFYHLMNQINLYSNILKNYIHLLKIPWHQIEDIHNDWLINEGFLECQMNKCKYLSYIERQP